nr:hypothetical protein Iba_chr12cCG18390 [Ipomoea batatas]
MLFSCCLSYMSELFQDDLAHEVLRRCKPVNNLNCPRACLMNISTPLTTAAPTSAASCRRRVFLGTLTITRVVLKTTLQTGVSSVLGCIPMAEAFARIIPFSGQKSFKRSYGSASPDIALARAFALSSQQIEF